MKNTDPAGHSRASHASLTVLAVSTAFLLAACGGGGGVDPPTSNTPTAPVVPVVPSTSSLSGSVVDGPVRGATVKAFQIGGGIPGETAIATATTAPDGSYSLTLPTTATIIVVTANGGRYCAGSKTAQVSDASTCAEGTLTNLVTPLITVTSTAAGGSSKTAHITPISTAAAQTAASLHVTGEGIVHVLEGAMETTSFASAFTTLTGGALPEATLQDQDKLLAAVAAMQPATNLAGAIANIQAGALKGASATLAQVSFSIKQGGMVQNLGGNDDDTAIVKNIDPTQLTTAANGSKSGTGASVNRPYFVPRADIDAATLKTIMEDNSVPDVAPHASVIVTIGHDSYRGYKLADVIVRATRFRPRDSSNPNAYGVTTAIVAFSAEGRTAAFSFTELIRTQNGEKTIVAFEKNGAPLPAGEGALAIIPGNDYDTWLRRVPRLKEIHVRNDFLPTTLTADAGTPESVQFSLAGSVVDPITITAAARSTASSQGYYAVDHIGSMAVNTFATYFFSQYGPRHTNFWWGQGIRLTDVLNTAGLSYPNDKGACFVVVRSRINVPAVFSCGELYNSDVGVGDGLAGSDKRSRRKGVLLVTDDYRTGSGNNVMMTCWGSIDSCTKNDAGNPDAYTTGMDSNGDSMNNSFIALVSTEDVVPFQPVARWFPFNRTTDGLTTCGGPSNCIPWINVGERLQQGITSLELFYAGGTGNGTRSAGGGGGGGHSH
ncbi:MAG: hypothetical protein WDO56_00325 [Gammaproteobacteria bacterium]